MAEMEIYVRCDVVSDTQILRNRVQGFGFPRLGMMCVSVCVKGCVCNMMCNIMCACVCSPVHAYAQSTQLYSGDSGYCYATHIPCQEIATELSTCIIVAGF